MGQHIIRALRAFARELAGPVAISRQPPRRAYRAQRRSRAEREKFEATTAQLRRENTERELVAAVSDALFSRIGGGEL